MFHSTCCSLLLTSHLKYPQRGAQGVQPSVGDGSTDLQLKHQGSENVSCSYKKPHLLGRGTREVECTFATDSNTAYRSKSTFQCCLLLQEVPAIPALERSNRFSVLEKVAEKQALVQARADKVCFVYYAQTARITSVSIAIHRNCQIANHLSMTIVGSSRGSTNLHYEGGSLLILICWKSLYSVSFLCRPNRLPMP